jgi:ankyrin repeat protein
VNFRDENGWTPLALVLEHSDWIYLVSTPTKNLDLISLLLAHSANVHAAEEYWRTPLMSAVEAGNEAVARMVLEGGADARRRDRVGMTAEDYVWVGDDED